MYLKIKIVKPLKNKFWKNDLIVSQVHAIDNDWKYIKAVKLTEEVCKKLIDSPILIEQDDCEKLLD